MAAEASIAWREHHGNVSLSPSLSDMKRGHGHMARQSRVETGQDLGITGRGSVVKGDAQRTWRRSSVNKNPRVLEVPSIEDDEGEGRKDEHGDDVKDRDERKVGGPGPLDDGGEVIGGVGGRVFFKAREG